jgi:urease accessory protein UreE
MIGHEPFAGGSVFWQFPAGGWMWCERVLRNAAGETPAQWERRDVDFVDLAWDECLHVLKKRSRNGKEVRVLLPPDQRLQHGDVLYEDDACALLVNVLACDVVVARPESPRDAAALALELGNLHVPTQITDDEILFLEDESALEALAKSRVRWQREQRRFEPMEVIALPAVRRASGLRIIRRERQAPLPSEPSRNVASSA